MTDIACGPVRAALSADVDGEDGGVDGEVVARHLEACDPCQRFADALPTVARRTRLAAAAPVPDLTARITTALDTVDLAGTVDTTDTAGTPDRAGTADPVARATAAASDRRRRRLRDLRILVGLAGGAQLITALPVLLGVIGPDLHLGRDLGALQIALGVGLLFAAVQPRRAAGLLPVVAVVVGVTLVTASVDVATGGASLAGELTHLSELVGVLALWGLVRHQPPQTSAARDDTATDGGRDSAATDRHLEPA